MKIREALQRKREERNRSRSGKCERVEVEVS